jgi:hypothetical protein
MHSSVIRFYQYLNPQASPPLHSLNESTRLQCVNARRDSNFGVISSTRLVWFDSTPAPPLVLTETRYEAISLLLTSRGELPHTLS